MQFFTDLMYDVSILNADLDLRPALLRFSGADVVAVRPRKLPCSSCMAQNVLHSLCITLQTRLSLCDGSAQVDLLQHKISACRVHRKSQDIHLLAHPDQSLFVLGQPFHVSE